LDVIIAVGALFTLTYNEVAGPVPHAFCLATVIFPETPLSPEFTPLFVPVFVDEGPVHPDGYVQIQLFVLAFSF